MSLFAQIDKKGIVKNVIVADQPFIDSGKVGKADIWIETSDALRKNPASIGFTYDSVRDAFIPPQPHSAWLLDEKSCQWVPPTQPLQDGKNYGWSDKHNDWREILTIKVCEYPDENNADFSDKVSTTIYTPAIDQVNMQ